MSDLKNYMTKLEKIKSTHVSIAKTTDVLLKSLDDVKSHTVYRTDDYNNRLIFALNPTDKFADVISTATLKVIICSMKFLVIFHCINLNILQSRLFYF